jgi:hypothetical protein
MRSHRDRSHARPAATVRNRKSFVKVDVADVSADRRRAGQSNLGIHVGAVHVDLATMFVDDSADLPDLLLEHAVRRRIGHHQRRQIFPVLLGLRPQVRKIDVALAVASGDNDLQARHGRTRRIGSVCRRRNQDNVAVALASRALVGTDGHQAGELPLRTRIRLQRDRREPGDPAECLFELREHLRVPLRLLARDERMQS